MDDDEVWKPRLGFGRVPSAVSTGGSPGIVTVFIGLRVLSFALLSLFSGGLVHRQRRCMECLF